MTDSFRLKIFTPEGPFLDEEVTAVTLQNSEGEIGILPGHVRYISLLGTGILSYVVAGSSARQIVASEGFCHMTEGTFFVLADRVMTREEAGAMDVSASKISVKKELEEANFIDPKWDIKRIELKTLESAERLIQN